MATYAFGCLLLAFGEKMYQFEKLEIWTLSLDIVEQTYAIVNKLPKEEKYCLGDQLRRAAVSISLNIAEGKGSSSDKELVRFLKISLRSLYEVIGGLKIAIRLKFVTEEECKAIFDLCNECGAKTNKFIRNLIAKGK